MASFVIAVTIALGVATGTASLAVAGRVLLERLPYRESDRLAIVLRSAPAKGLTQTLLSFPNYEDLSRSSSFIDPSVSLMIRSAQINLLVERSYLLANAS